MGEAVAYRKSAFRDGEPRFSPDGRFVVYVSDESGSREVYVSDFPNAREKWLISSHGGAMPRWRRDGKEIFYIEGRRLMAASVTTGSKFSAAAPLPLFPVQGGYDVAADGKRFVVLQRPAGEPPLAIHVVHNWFEEFRSR
jgi:dipeptidyl aminopeptidase/acylaminoacyl peptidase